MRYSDDNDDVWRQDVTITELHVGVTMEIRPVWTHDSGWREDYLERRGTRRVCRLCFGSVERRRNVSGWCWDRPEVGRCCRRRTDSPRHAAPSVTVEIYVRKQVSKTWICIEHRQSPWCDVCTSALREKSLWRPLLSYGYSYYKSILCQTGLSLVIFNIQALWRSRLSVRVDEYQKLQMMA